MQECAEYLSCNVEALCIHVYIHVHVCGICILCVCVYVVSVCTCIHVHMYVCRHDNVLGHLVLICQSVNSFPILSAWDHTFVPREYLVPHLEDLFMK